MKIKILTLFPNMFKGPFDESIIKRGIDKGLISIEIHNLRKWGINERGTVDNRPYGGGKGMILRVDVVENALKELREKNTHTILLTPTGIKFNQIKAIELSKLTDIILIAGHYEGFDARISELVDEELSIGDYVLTGGELPAMVLADTVSRLVEGVLEKEATEKESFTDNLLEYPQYTKPDNFKGSIVPEILKSGNHKKIENWRQEKSIEKTKKVRSDLLTDE